MQPGPDGLRLRPLAPSDSLDALTALLHDAYAGLARLGFFYAAYDQPVEETARRCRTGEPWVAELGSRVVGTVVFRPAAETRGCPWYNRPEVASFGQFAVAPALQRSGIGSRLLDLCEERARVTGARELALDTAEGASHLIDWYSRCGYSLREFAKWPSRAYRSVILSKRLAPTAGGARED